jgi:hypothetical protein
VSLLLVFGSVVLYLVTCRAKTFEHADRLALLPLKEAEPKPTTDSERKER